MHSNQETSEHVLSLEARLAADVSGTVRQELETALETELSAVKQRMNGGLPPSDWQVAEQYSIGLQAALDVVAVIWKREHSSATSPYSPIPHFG